MSKDIKLLETNAPELVEGARKAVPLTDDSFWIELDQHFNGGGPEEPKVEARRIAEAS